MGGLRLFLVILSFICRPAPAVRLPEGVYEVSLDPMSRHKLYWVVDYPNQIIQFEVHIKDLQPRQWFTLGFSDYGDHESADYCLFYPDNWGLPALVGATTDDKCLVSVMEECDCRDFKVTKASNITKFSFKRAFDTCKPGSYVIEEGTTHIVWAMGRGDLDGQSLCDRDDEGMVRVQILKNETPNPSLEPSVWIHKATVPRVRVPPSDTTYWCHTVKLPSRLHRKHHLVKFEAVISKGNEGLVHHMELFHCAVEKTARLPFYSGPCPKKPRSLTPCSKVIAAWAIGALPFYYPPETGLPVGGSDESLYAMLEIHYNNPKMRDDWIDSSGVKIYLTPDLRQYDAAIIELGLEYVDKMAIPPRQPEFILSGYCTSECTAVSLPQGGIVAFASQLHTHLTGTRVETRHVRKGKELPRLNWDYHYSPHYQEIRLLKRKVHILPGDALITTCTYNTVSRPNITLGGFATTDEMCVNYMYYYPKTALEVCKSSISDAYLAGYFNYLKNWENQPTSRDLPISESYGSIEWTKLRVELLHGLYYTSPVYMQCNNSAGERFPGNWEEIPLTKVETPLVEPRRTCGEEDDEE